MLVVVFRSSSNLASAYGIAVNTSMVVDTMLALVFFWKARNLPLFIVIPALLAVFTIELTFLAANGLKLAKGGYMPVLIGSTIISAHGHLDAWKVCLGRQASQGIH